VAEFDVIPLGLAQQKVREAIVLPVKLRVEEQVIGILIAGVNPTRKLDQDYLTFYELVAGHVATAIANAHAYQEERKRAKALAELDKAKTTFFSNVSHELRTPLTLMLGPIESALARANQADGQREEFELLHRNAMRLLKLVNALLDFSRIEAGRLNANYEPINLAALTRDLASVFRSAAERAGLTLRVECSPLSESVYVDREMWEKIVLNLLSNAFKSTFHGEIAVSLNETGSSAVLSVSDTGTGIPADEIPRLFERFRRVEGARRRSNEGSGIGLALVHELVTMHGGSISVSSSLGIGTTFTIALPLGTSHLPADQIARTERESAHLPSNAVAYVHEALGWLPDENVDTEMLLDVRSVSTGDALQRHATEPLGTVLLVDDNHDMREYVRRLLSQRFHVRTAENGRIALEMAVADLPDLVLTDVMMPEMDGFQLLTALRSNSATGRVPVVMLSARAGEESRVEGLQAGADDYLVKPFTARELLARVESHIKMAHFRRQAAEHEAELQQEIEQARNVAAQAVEHISDGFWIYDSEWRVTYMNPAAETLSRRSREEQIGRTVWQLWPETLGSELEQQFHWAMRERRPVEFEWVYEPWQRWFRYRVYPTPDEGLAVYVKDSTESRLTEQALRRAEQLAAAGKLAASISHEINNPLEAITNLLFLAKSDPELSDPTKNFLQVADAEVQRLSHIARTSLKFYRQSSLPSAVQVKELLESVLMVHQARMTKLAITIRKDYRDAPELHCYSSELQQVFTNLISNALDAMNRGGTLWVSVRPSHGGSGWQREGVRIIVADSGIGMGPAVRSRLFEPFFTTKMENGTGLGLWVTRNIVEKHGGSINVLSSPGKGTAFSIFFPHAAELGKAAG
jgi:PAS domain S-box-containing protein